MNKTIIININGIVFHIEENAYEVLVKYMNEVKQHFGYSTDSYEIVSDIENRLAEMFSEKMTESGKEVIVLSDVETVIAQMGKPSDFDWNEEQVSEEKLESTGTERKLFRDMDDRIIGGVCAGIGHYFDIEPRWIRIMLLFSFLIFGSGFFLYILLWIVMPKAQTRAEKMAMKGEKPNLQNFKKNFDEEMDSIKQNLNKAQQEAKPFLQRLGRFIEQLFSHLGKFLGSTGKLILKIIGGFIIFIGIALLFSLFVALLAVLGIWNSGDLPVFPFNIVNPEYQHALYISAFIVVFIPLISLLLFAIRVLFNRPILNRNISFGLLAIWIVALSTGLYYGFRTGGEFKQEARYTETTVLKASPVFYLHLNEQKFLTKADSLQYQIEPNHFKGRIIINSHEHDMPDNFELSIEKSDVNQPMLITEYRSNGKTFQNALESAKKIQYQFVQQDSTLQFNDNIYIKPGELWRNQMVKLTLRIPLDTRLIIDRDLNRYLNNYNLYDCMPQGDEVKTTSEFIMTANGLTCKNDSLYKHNRMERGLR